MIINIIIGLIGLNIIVFFHELGHLIAAKSTGIEVEAFSIGWGKRLWGRRWRGTDYRISLFPLGGFCRMKGEQEFMMRRAESHTQSKSNDQTGVPDGDDLNRRSIADGRSYGIGQTDAQAKETQSDQRGSFYHASPWKRIIVAISGPLANLLFAIFVFAVVSLFPVTYQTYENRVVLLSEFSPGEYPADIAGIESGDRIVSVNDQPVGNFRQLRESILDAFDRSAELIVDRNGRMLALMIRPQISAGGAPQIGVYPWIDPVVRDIEPGSSAELAGMRQGDRIISINGKPIRHSIDIDVAIREAGAEVPIVVSRNGERVERVIVPGTQESGEVATGIIYPTENGRVEANNLFQAIGTGVSDTMQAIVLSVRGIGLLVTRQVGFGDAVAGPIRITQIVGDVTTSANNFASGIRVFFTFLCFISIALGITNLLPIPVLDGGHIALYLIEGVFGKPLNPMVVYRYQLIGTAIVFILLALTLFSDIRFLFGN